MAGVKCKVGKLKRPTLSGPLTQLQPRAPLFFLRLNLCFFRGGGDAPPVSESVEEEAEARVNLPRALVTVLMKFAADKGV